MPPRLGSDSRAESHGAVTDLTYRAMILGLMLGAFGCSSSLISCSSSLMSCPSSLMDSEEEDRLHTEVASAGAQGNLMVEAGAAERFRAEKRTSRQANSPERASHAPSAARPGDVDAAVQNPQTTESVPTAVVRIALKYLGVPYRWGGLTPAGFDCSGFVKYLHARVGISIPHNVAAQYRYGTPVSRDQLKAGDLVFFDRLRHNGIYIGHRQFIHASRTGDGVKISSLDGPWYKSRWIGGRRLSHLRPLRARHVSPPWPGTTPAFRAALG